MTYSTLLIAGSLTSGTILNLLSTCLISPLSSAPALSGLPKIIVLKGTNSLLLQSYSLKAIIKSFSTL